MPRSEPVRIRFSQLLKAQGSETGGSTNENSYRLAQEIGHHSWRPKSNNPATSNGIGQPVAHAVLEGKLFSPPINSYRLKHPPAFCPSERPYAGPCQKQHRCKFSRRQLRVF